MHGGQLLRQLFDQARLHLHEHVQFDGVPCHADELIRECGFERFGLRKQDFVDGAVVTGQVGHEAVDD